MSSPEYLAYRKCISEINSTTANNVSLDWFATELCQESIIAQAVSNKMGVLGMDNLQKANVLTSAILSKLQYDSDSFLTVITIMKKEPAFAHVLKELSEVYGGDSEDVKSALKPPASEMTRKALKGDQKTMEATSSCGAEKTRKALKDLPLTLANLLNELDEVTDSHNLGLSLGVPPSELKVIEQNYPRDAVRQKSETLNYWFDNEEDPSWEKIARAVEKRHRNLARRIRGKQPPAPSKPDNGVRKRHPMKENTPDVPDRPSPPASSKLEPENNGQPERHPVNKQTQESPPEHQSFLRKHPWIIRLAVVVLLLCGGVVVYQQYNKSTVDCDKLPAPENGKVKVYGTTEGSRATYSCTSGYDLTGNGGNRERVCQANGQWSGVAPTCVKIPQSQTTIPSSVQTTKEPVPTGPAKCTEVKNLKVVKDELKEVSEWKILGQDLGLSKAVINQIDMDEHTAEEKRRTVIEKWFEGSEHSCWEEVVNALSGMGQVKLASRIANKYGVEK